MRLIWRVKILVFHNLFSFHIDFHNNFHSINTHPNHPLTFLIINRADLLISQQNAAFKFDCHIIDDVIKYCMEYFSDRSLSFLQSLALYW